MENSTKAVIIAASLVITLLIVTVGFMILRSGQEAAKQSLSKMNETTNALSESDYTTYEGYEASGSEVLNALQKFKNKKVGIYVDTTAAGSGTWYINMVDSTGKLGSASSASLTDTRDVTQEKYINPNGRFMGEVVRDANGVITGLKFIQQ